MSCECGIIVVKYTLASVDKWSKKDLRLKIS